MTEGEGASTQQLGGDTMWTRGQGVEQGQGVARIKQEAGDLEEEADRNSEEEGGGGINTVQSPSPNTVLML